MKANTFVFQTEEPFELESGYVFNRIELSYTINGNIANLNNATWICHGITANQHPEEWWSEQVGEDKVFDPKKEPIISVNVPGSSYGSIGPLSQKETFEEPYLHEFPAWTVKDVVNAFDLLRSELGIAQIKTLVGTSVGGMIVLQWAAINPNIADQLILIATNAVHSAWGKAFNAAQRMSLEADSSFYNTKQDGGEKGLATARAIALLSYRTPKKYNTTQHDFLPLKGKTPRADTYQRYQGKKLVERFNAHSYYTLTQLMDSHNIADERSLEVVLQSIKNPTLVIGVDSDLLFPIEEQYFLFEHIPNAHFGKIISDFGHDAFLIENQQLTNILKTFLTEQTIDYGSKSA